MKAIVGIILVIAGIATGIYAGIWWAFIGGICDVITAARAEDLVPMDVAIGAAKVVFAGVIGWITAMVLVVPGLAILKD